MIAANAVLCKEIANALLKNLDLIIQHIYFLGVLPSDPVSKQNKRAILNIHFTLSTLNKIIKYLWELNYIFYQPLYNLRYSVHISSANQKYKKLPSYD